MTPPSRLGRLVHVQHVRDDHGALLLPERGTDGNPVTDIRGLRIKQPEAHLVPAERRLPWYDDQMIQDPVTDIAKPRNFIIILKPRDSIRSGIMHKGLGCQVAPTGRHVPEIADPESFSGR